MQTQMQNSTNTMGLSSSYKLTRVIAITGGKGGVGKSNVAINLAVALAKEGQRVLLLDADLGLANIDILLGLRPSLTLEHVFAGEADLKEIILEGPEGIGIIPASSGTQKLTQLSKQEHGGLIAAFSELTGQYDVLLIDTAAGISDGVVSFVRASQEVIVVVCDEPSSVTDAYALIKLLNRDYRMTRFRVLANMVRSEQEGRNMFGKLLTVTDRFLDVTLQYVGSIPYDENVRKAVQRQVAVLQAFPKSKVSLAYKQLANKVNGWPVQAAPRGHLEFFVERLVQGVRSSD